MHNHQYFNKFSKTPENYQNSQNLQFVFWVIEAVVLWFCSEIVFISNVTIKYKTNLIWLFNFCNWILISPNKSAAEAQQEDKVIEYNEAKSYDEDILLQLCEISTTFICISITILLPLIHIARLQTNSIFDPNSDCLPLMQEGELSRIFKVYVN